jgi:hypothetical protein
VLYPADIAPFTRKNLFVVVDADRARQFHLLSQHGPCGPTPGGEIPVVLCAAPCAPPKAPPANRNGAFFTLCLTNPSAGARALCGDSGSVGSLAAERNGPPDGGTDSAEKRVLHALTAMLVEAESRGALHASWAKALHDPFLRSFTVNFVLCRALVAAHVSTRTEETTLEPSRFSPTCSPSLPEICDAESPACAAHASAFVAALGLAREFRFRFGAASE